MPTIKGKIESASFLKSGTGAKGPWVMFEVVVAGQKFTGFGDTWQKSIGQEGEFEYKEEQRTSARGTTYMSRTIQNPRRPGGANPQLLQEMNKKLDDILSILRGPVPTQQSNYPNDQYQGTAPAGQEDINVEDIPF